VRFYLHNTFPNFATVQILESRLCDVETKSGGIDSGNRNGRVVRYVGWCVAKCLFHEERRLLSLSGFDL
jgi:hypothetical protein